MSVRMKTTCWPKITPLNEKLPFVYAGDGVHAHSDLLPADTDGPVR